MSVSTTKPYLLVSLSYFFAEAEVYLAFKPSTISFVILSEGSAYNKLSKPVLLIIKLVSFGYVIFFQEFVDWIA